MAEHNYFDDQLQTNEREEYLSQWRSETEFEEEVRDILKLLRPHRGERLKGWREHRSRGDGFRVTVSWDPAREGVHEPFCIPKIADVIESLLVGSAREQDLLDPHVEFELYAGVVRELGARLKELRSRYE